MNLEFNNKASLTIFDSIINLIEPEEAFYYQDILQNQGFKEPKDWDRLRFLTNEQLQSLGIKLGHLQLFQKAVNQRKKQVEKNKYIKKQNQFINPPKEIFDQRSKEYSKANQDITRLSQNLYAGRYNKMISKGLVGLDGVINLSLLALLSQESIILFGPPGTGKTTIAQRIADLLRHADKKSKSFYILLTKFTTPDEIFGPYSIEHLKEGKLQRITKGYLPSASVVLLDEVFKASSSILNTLLRIMNEKQFINDGKDYHLPIQLIMGASNELPNEDLDALYDRFLIRQWMTPLTGDLLTKFLSQLSKRPIQSQERVESYPELNRYSLALLRLRAQMTIEMDKEISHFIEMLIEALRKHSESGDPFNISERRIFKAINLIKICAFLRSIQDQEYKVLYPDCFVLKHIFASTDRQKQVIQQIIDQLIRPLLIQLCYRDLKKFIWLDQDDQNYLLEVNYERNKIDQIMVEKLSGKS